MCSVFLQEELEGQIILPSVNATSILSFCINFGFFSKPMRVKMPSTRKLCGISPKLHLKHEFPALELSVGGIIAFAGLYVVPFCLASLLHLLGLQDCCYSIVNSICLLSWHFPKV